MSNQPNAKQVTLTIDGIQVTVPEGIVVVDAAKRAGIDIPVFCYHPKMKPVGMCRMCLVEVGRPEIDRATGQFAKNDDGSTKLLWGRTLETGCTVAVSEGMVVRHSGAKVDAGRQDILEFILTSHPLDCPVCDKGGECPLQNLTMAHGPGQSRFLFDDKIKLAKHVPLGELIFLDRERCIQCARCTRFQAEIVDDPVIGFYSRGRSLEIQTHSDPGFDSYWSGNTSDICPVGALTTADFRFGARPWELNQAASICNQCAVGCNITFNTRREAKTGGNFVIKRVMPRQNEQVNEIWICDKGRFSAYHFSEHPDRLSQPLVRREGKLVPATWGEALDLVAEKFKEAGAGLGVVASGRLSNEDLFNLHKLAELQGGKTFLDTTMGGGDLTASLGLSAGSNLGSLGKDDTALVVACDLEEEAPIWWLRVKQAAERGATVIVLNPRATKLDRAADYKLTYRYGEEVEALQNLLKSEHPAAQTLRGDANLLIFFGSEGLGVAGSQALAQACANLLVETGKVGKPNSGLVGVWSRPNDQGAWEMGFRPAENLASALGSQKVLYFAAADPVGDQPTLASALNDKFVVVQDLFLTETAKLADVVLPAAPYTGREGSFTSGERRVQRYYLAVPDHSGARPDFTITAQIASRLGLTLEGRLAARVFAQIGSVFPAFAGLTFIHLAQVEEQWPIVGRGDMYYGGTTYENSQGLGVHLAAGQPPAAAVAPKALSLPAAEWVAVPVTDLYDRGALVSRSGTLQPRLANPYVRIHPADAAKMGAGETILASVAGVQLELQVVLDDTMPQGTAGVPRSLGLPLVQPEPLQIIERTAA